MDFIKCRDTIVLAIVIIISISQIAIASGHKAVDLGQPYDSVPDIESSELNPRRLLVIMLAGLVFTLFLLVLVGRLLARRLGLPSKAGGCLALIDTLSLGPGKGIMVIAVEQKRYLIGVAAERINLLAELTDQELPLVEKDALEFSKIMGGTRS